MSHQIREGVPNSAKKVEKLGFVGKRHVVDLAIALENGRFDCLLCHIHIY